jgi:hypothetical protein
MVAKKSDEPRPEFVDQLTTEFYPSILLKKKGDYFVGKFGGNITQGSTEYGVVNIIDVELVEGRFDVNSPIGVKPGDMYSFWLMGKVVTGQFKRLRPEAGELIGVYREEKKRNRANTFSYWDDRVAVLDREKKVISWDDLPGDEESEKVVYSESADPEF